MYRPIVAAARRAAFPRASAALPMRTGVASLSTGVDSFMSGSNSVYVEQMYTAWKQDPKSVHTSWQAYFGNLESGVSPTAAFTAPPSIRGSTGVASAAPAAAGGAIAPSAYSSDSLNVAFLIDAYQVSGHKMANLDPLGIHAFRQHNDGVPPELDHKYHGFSDADLDRKLNLYATSSGGNTGFYDQLIRERPNLTLRQIIEILQKTYCSNLGVEYMHMGTREKCNWIRTQVESPKWMNFSKAKKLHIYERLTFADHFEKFLANKFNTTKRFGLEGGESCIPGLKCMIDRGSELGVETFVFGMAHRGRLNVLANVLRKPFPQIFKEFQGTHYSVEEYMDDSNSWTGAGDVKYHLGTSINRTYPDGRKVHISLAANPSHLEAVNPVVLGKTRAKQFINGMKGADTNKHMSVLIHGDAAFAGQGVVYESMQMSKVPDYGVGGTVHVIINNQVGFTTNPSNSRSTYYSSDLGKAFNIPIFHCNGDDPLSVVSAFEMAVEWRQRFGEDCIIDLICYRRYGHNELDQPMYTQPQLYSKIAKHPDTLTIFGKRLVDEGTCTAEELANVRKSVNDLLNKEFEASKTWHSDEDWLSDRWSGLKSPRQRADINETGVPLATLKEIGSKMCEIPPTFTIHKQLEKIIAARRETIEKGENLDWATAEALAFGTLLAEDNHVRLSGQDVQRGTFSHRHAVLIDQKTGAQYAPLNNICKEVSRNIHATKSANATPGIQAEFTCQNSILSEFAVLGFELGYSMESPNNLTIWEAQFGDFVNGAQIMLDQFISAGEDKWLRQTGLTMLLPHGYMGQGAEHSSCRIERFLQQCDEDEIVPKQEEDGDRRQLQLANWQVCNVSTPANYYHVLRRQVHRQFRKPLVIATTKNLLRDRRCVSSLADLAEGTKFQLTYSETDASISNAADKVRKLILCSGKIYYELVEEREKRGIKDIAIVRVEQLAPFPFDNVAQECALYKNAEIVWCQEEPKNMGCWAWVQPRIASATGTINNNERRAAYVGRDPAAATATGYGGAHNAEQKKIIESALA